MNEDLGRDGETSAERRMVVHLESLRAHPPLPPPALTARVVRSARWQRAVRPYLAAAGGMIGAAGAAMEVLLEPRRA